MAHLHAGTSGFAYSNWKPVFYPSALPAREFLPYYSRRLNAVEINYTFRRLPSPETIKSWASGTPRGFAFCLKAPMRITHILRLKDASDFLKKFLAAIAPLRTARKLGPILFQLPPQFHCDPERLRAFLASLPKGFKYVFEFRDASWLNSSVYGLLRKYHVALCLAESEKLEVPEVVTAGFVYYRLRRPDYAAKDIKAIRERFTKFLKERKDVYVFFKHEDTPEGALHAEDLLRATGKAGGRNLSRKH